MEVELSLNNLRRAHEAELRRGTNNLARASWKYHFFRKNEIEHYANYLTEDIRPTDVVTYRRNTITKLNYFIPTVIHAGKWSIDKYFTKYHVSFKIGQFTKNRKPFYFRSKKKKKCYKKIPYTIKYLT